MSDIFTSFVQASASTARKYGGTGLGLSISKHLVEMQGGTIGLSSKEGEGTIFTFIIPYGKPIEIEVTTTGSTDERTVLKGTRILLVEDNKFNQMVAVDSLQSIIPNVLIEVAENGRVAIEKIREQTFDLVLLDLQMPEMDGYETAQQLRNHPEIQIREIPIVALTANATKTEKEKCMSAGMNGYISKPFHSKDLLLQIQQVLSGHPSSA